MKILLIEDDNTIRNILKMSLESESFAVDEAVDGESGSFMARINKYDLIILDMVLPKKSGKQVCKDIREDNVDTPILMLTGKSDVLTKIDLLNTGADDYVTKPFSFEELLARLKALLRRPSRIEGDILKVGDVRLNKQSNEVTVRNKKIYLTRKEYSLLELLMKNKGNLVSRATIMEHVWNTNANPFSNTIEAHIRNLRKKIKDNKRKIIISMAGRGYKMTESSVKRSYTRT